MRIHNVLLLLAVSLLCSPALAATGAQLTSSAADEACFFLAPTTFLAVFPGAVPGPVVPMIVPVTGEGFMDPIEDEDPIKKKKKSDRKRSTKRKKQGGGPDD
jgi:hypothetical protein